MPHGEPEPEDVALSDAEWAALAALQTELDLAGPGWADAEAEGEAHGAPRPAGFSRRLVVWLWWLLDPKAEGLPMPPLLDPERRRHRPGQMGTGRPAGP